MKYKGILKRIGYSTLIALVLACAVFGWYVPPQPAHAAPADAYWVGDGGNWSDALNHWAIVSGGAPGAGNLPDATTNVHFDANSFTVGGQTVTLDAAGFCFNMDWTGATDNPTFDMAAANLTVHGHFTLISAMTWTTSGQFVYFKDGNTPNIITSAGSIVFNRAYLQNAGSWQFADAFSVSGGALYPQAGTLDTNGQVVAGNCAISGTANVILGATVWTSGNWTWTSTGSLTANTSTIKITGTGGFTGGGETYNNVELNGTAHTISGNNTFASLTNAATSTVTLGATTQTTGAWINAGTVAATTGTIIVTGTGGFTGGGETYNNVELNGTAHTVSGNNTFASLTNAGTSTATLTGTTQTVTSSLSNVGSIVDGIINLTGTASIGGGGQNSGIMNLNGTAHTISGSNTFGTLTLAPGTAQTITFTDGTTQTVTTPVLSGTAGNIHTLQGSGSAGWNITGAGGGSPSFSYLSVTDSTAGPNIWYADDGTSVDGGNNINWYFNPGGVAAFQLLQAVLTVILAAGIIVVVIKTTNNPVTMLLEVVIGIIAIVIVLEMIF